MGGIAFRAPMLATLFLIVALATLAMPGSGNFVGEFLILLGLFTTKLVFAIVAFAGVVMAARLHAADVHPRRCTTAPGRTSTRASCASSTASCWRRSSPRSCSSRSTRSSRSTGPRSRSTGAVARPPVAAAPARPRRRPACDCRRTVRASTDDVQIGAMNPLLATAHLKGPHVDFAALSPLIALLGGSIVVLMVGLLRLALGALASVVPALTPGHAAARRSA